MQTNICTHVHLMKGLLWFIDYVYSVNTTISYFCKSSFTLFLCSQHSAIKIVQKYTPAINRDIPIFYLLPRYLEFSTACFKNGLFTICIFIYVNIVMQNCKWYDIIEFVMFQQLQI